MTTMYQDPSKIIIYLDLYRKVSGNEFRFYPAINTFETMEELRQLLSDIKTGRYRQKNTTLQKSEFASAVDVLSKIIKWEDK